MILLHNRKIFFLSFSTLFSSNRPNAKLKATIRRSIPTAYTDALITKIKLVSKSQNFFHFPGTIQNPITTIGKKHKNVKEENSITTSLFTANCRFYLLYKCKSFIR